MSHFVCVCHEVGKGQHGEKNKGEHMVDLL